MSSNTPGSMERERTKFMYQFLPNNTFNHANNSLSGQVRMLHQATSGWGEKEAPFPDDSENYVISRLNRHITRWPLRDVDDFTHQNAEFVNPGGASYAVYPLLFECASCKSLTTFRESDIKDLTPETSSDRVACNHCNRPLTDSMQLPFVAVCHCGEMRELWVPDHCGSNMRLTRPTTQMADWTWVCVGNGCGHRQSYFTTPVYCPKSKKADFHPEVTPEGEEGPDRVQMQVMNHTDSKAFYAQTQSLVNVKPNLNKLTRGDFKYEIVSDYLLGDDADTEPSEMERGKLAAQLLAEAADEDFEFEDAYEQAGEQLTTDHSAHRTGTRRRLDESFSGSEQTTLAEEIYEYLSIVSDKHAPEDGITAETYASLAAGENGPPNPEASRYDTLREGLNLADLRILNNVPITTVSYGYTRIESEPPNSNAHDPAQSDAVADGQRGDDGAASSTDGGGRTARLRSFRSRGRNQVFAQTNSAEGVMVSLDQELLIEWLLDCGAITDAYAPDTDDAEALKWWFIENVTKPDRYENLTDDAPQNSLGRISRYVYTLLHTISHQFINGVAALAGHQSESLQERLMPRATSFFIYKRPDTDFSLGSIWTLFEERFDEFEQHFRTDLDDCSYDPLCKDDENGACEDCLYLSSITCQNVNHNLGRSTLYGGGFDGDNISGYIDM